jgi:hypothetical protein
LDKRSFWRRRVRHILLSPLSWETSWGDAHDVSLSRKPPIFTPILPMVALLVKERQKKYFFHERGNNDRFLATEEKTFFLE